MEPMFPAITAAHEWSSEEKVTTNSGLFGGDQHARYAMKMIAAARPTISKFQRQARECARFKAGHHFSTEDEEANKLEGRPNAAFNTAQKFIRFISGLQRQMMWEISFVPRSLNNDKQAGAGELASKGYQWALGAYGDDNRAEAFTDMVTGGMGWTETRMDLIDDIDGRIKLDHIPWEEMLWDTRAKTPGLVGVRWVARERIVSKEEAIVRFGDEYRDVIDNYVGQTSGAERNANPTVLISEKQAVPVRGEASWPALGPDEIKVTEFQWYEEVPGVFFYDPITRKADWLGESEYREFQRRYKKTVVGLRVTLGRPDLPSEILHDRRLQREWKRVVIIGNRTVQGPDDLPGKRFTFNCMTGQLDQSDGIFYGYMRELMDPQRYMTKYLNQLMEITLRSNKGGVVIEEDAVNDMAEFEDNWAVAGSVSKVKKDRLGAFKEKQGYQMPSGAYETFTMCATMLTNVAGINPDVAIESGDVPTSTVRQRQAAALVLLTIEFDSLKRYQKHEAETILDFLRLLADDRWVRVGEPEDVQYIQLVKSEFFLEYDVLMDISTRDPEIRKQYLAALEKFAPTLMRMGNFTGEMIDLLPFPAKMRRMLKEGMQRTNERKQQLAAQGIQDGGRGKPTSYAELQARTQKIQADAALQQAKALEISEHVKGSKGKMILDAMIKQKEMEAREREGQQRMELEKTKGASQEAMGILNLIGRQSTPHAGTG